MGTLKPLTWNSAPCFNQSTRRDPQDAVFVLGALSDSKRRLRGLTRDKADAQGIASVRLPIKENLGLDAWVILAWNFEPL